MKIGIIDENQIPFPLLLSTQVYFDSSSHSGPSVSHTWKLLTITRLSKKYLWLHNMSELTVNLKLINMNSRNVVLWGRFCKKKKGFTLRHQTFPQSKSLFPLNNRLRFYCCLLHKFYLRWKKHMDLVWVTFFNHINMTCYFDIAFEPNIIRMSEILYLIWRSFLR